MTSVISEVSAAIAASGIKALSQPCRVKEGPPPQRISMAAMLQVEEQGHPAATVGNTRIGDGRILTPANP
jgi:hypothetical protein